MGKNNLLPIPCSPLPKIKEREMKTMMKGLMSTMALIALAVAAQAQPLVEEVELDDHNDIPHHPGQVARDEQVAVLPPIRHKLGCDLLAFSLRVDHALGVGRMKF